MAVGNANPSTLFGGTWEKMSGGFLYGATSSVGSGNGTGTATAANNENTGSTVLTVEQMPNKTFIVNENGSVGIAYGSQHLGECKGSGKGHTHTLNNHTHNIPFIAVWIWKRTA